jgi:hypothetical protein
VNAVPDSCATKSTRNRQKIGRNRRRTCHP